MVTLSEVRPYSGGHRRIFEVGITESILTNRAIMEAMRIRVLSIGFLVIGAFVYDVPAEAAVVDSQLDASAQATQPPLTDYWTSISTHLLVPNFLAVGYVPPRDLSFSGVRFRINPSGGGNYHCPEGALMQYFGTSSPAMWDRGVIHGTLVAATTTPDANGNCEYITTDNWGNITPISVSPLSYYIFFMAVHAISPSGLDNWVSMSGKAFASSTPVSLFGYRAAASNYYVWGTGGLDVPYFELFDTAPPPVVPPPDPCVATHTCVSNVLFLPGIEGSRLYRPDYNGSTDKLWEPSSNDNVRDLYLNTDGTSLRHDVYTKEGDVIDELPTGENIYKSFITKMNELKTNGVLADWEPIAYDWRLSLDDILAYGNDVQGRIYYSGDLRATSTPYLIQELKRLAATSKSGKVTIVAHSNGGLLAKRLTEVLGPVESAQLIDKIFFVAVPQEGTPAAVPVALHGFGQDILFGLVTARSTARTFASTSPMAYTLLPSASYFTSVDDPVVKFDASLPEWVARYGSTVHSQYRLHQFLTDTFGKVDSQAGDINQPIQLNATLLSNAEALHSNLDIWTPPKGVPLIQIAGWGVPKTVSGITYTKKGTGVTPEADFTIDGDGTVVVPSALGGVATGTTNYWMDLKHYNNDHWLATLGGNGGLASFDHSRILETDTVVKFITDTLENISTPLSEYGYLSTVAPANSTLRLRYALHSPLTLNLYDANGRHTGISTSTGKVEEQIPDTYYTEFGDVKYIFTNASTSARVVMRGYAPGTFTFAVDEYRGDVRTASTTFKDIPTTASTDVSLSIQSDLATLSPMQVDMNGDGSIDATLVPKLNDVVTFDTTPPEFELSFSTTTRALSLIGTDESGTPEVTILSPDSNSHRRVKKESENQASRVIATALDGSGNKTVFSYNVRSAAAGRHLLAVPKMVTYNGATTIFAHASVSYEWTLSRDRSLSTFAAILRTASTTLVANYRAKEGTTNIIANAYDTRDVEDEEQPVMQALKETLPGLVIPYMKTKKGNLIIDYARF